MIRKVIIVVLTLGAVTVGGTCSVSWLSNRPLLFFSVRPENKAVWTFGATDGHLAIFHPTWPPQDGVSHSTFSFSGVFFVNKEYVGHSQGWSDGQLIDLGPRQNVTVGLHGLPIVIMLGVYPTFAFIRGPLRRHRRRKKGLCIVCGYDLTGSVSCTCPECGVEIKKP